MKFNVCVGNPPYDGKGNPLYLQILEECNKVCNNVIWLCPAQWVKNYKDSKFLKRIKTETCKNLISHEHIANPFNDAFVANEIGIYHFGTAEKYENYEDIRLERFKNPVLAKSIWKKFENYTDNLEHHNRIDKGLPYFPHASFIRGHFIDGKCLWDWTTLFGESQHTDFSKKIGTSQSPYLYWNFATELECKNFIASTETDICMFAHYICKINQANQGTVKLIPWFSDYTHEWTEEMIASELGLTPEEVNYIHEEMKDFGWKTRVKK